MKWVAISGSWRKTNEQVEKDVRREVNRIIGNDDGILAGAALGVDSFALDEAIKSDSSAIHVKVFLPSTLDRYAAHYRRRAKEGVITEDQAENLIAQLETLQSIRPDALMENKGNTVIDKATYYERNSVIIDNADELIAFQVNNSQGTQDAIDKAKKKGVKIKLFSYTIE